MGQMMSFKKNATWHCRCARRTFSAEISFLFLTMVIVLLSASPAWVAQKSATGSGRDDLLRHGKYIVENVAMCIECHTPRDKTGKLLRDQYLHGAAVPLSAPPYPQMKWALKAPAIAGLIGYTKEEGIRLLTQGITRDGRVPNPPMPPFRLSVQDAEAVVEYLKSLQ
jgi:mono/diheme cytochrome c family protein